MILCCEVLINCLIDTNCKEIMVREILEDNHRLMEPELRVVVVNFLIILRLLYISRHDNKMLNLKNKISFLI